MHRFVSSKRTVAWTITGVVIGTAGALSVPALADNAPRPRAASVQPLSLVFPESVLPPLETAHGSAAQVQDAGGNVIGTAYTNCDRNAQTATTHTAFCTGLVQITNGASAANGEIAFSAVLPVDTQATVPESGYFPGVVAGGTKAFDGITGETHFVLRSATVLDLNFG
ncbi:hypothetical protein [Kitasatospora sp. NPDC089509]|uniref:hypothetical protein n=1 Tax=Kitasatospora sp. NPDC089509 TaxID=3364079 RepID=UPI00380364FB